MTGTSGNYGAANTQQPQRSQQPHATMPNQGIPQSVRLPLEPQPFLPKKGNYRDLLVCYRNNQKERIAQLETGNAQLKARIARMEALMSEKGGER